MQVTFGEWVRWQLARLDLDRSEVARKLNISTKSVTNLYRRPDAEGISDVTLSRLADLLGITEPELVTKWRNGLPASPRKMPQSVLLTAWFERQDKATQRKVLAALPKGEDAKILKAAAARRRTKKPGK